MPPSSTTLPHPPISGEIIALTSLRGVAAMAVVMQHFSATAQLHAANNIPSLVPHGYLAVDLFFILSGFIMSYTYLAAFQRQGNAAFGSFMLKRIARIVPLNLAILALFVVAAHVSMLALGRNIIYSPQAGPGDILANMFMLQGVGIGLNLNGPSWSISAEFAAYLLFPLFISGAFSRHRMVRFAMMALSLTGLCWLAWSHPRLGMATETVPENLIRCFAEFGIGMATYRLFRDADEQQRRLLGNDVLCFGLMLGCAAFMLLRIDLPAVLLFPWLIVSLALNAGKAAKLMAHPALYFLGLVSFSLYLLHQLFRPLSLLLIQHLHPAPLATAPALLFALAASLSVIPFAWLTYRFVELPGRNLVRALRRGGKPATETAVSAVPVER